jgi:hypothetical protein
MTSIEDAFFNYTKKGSFAVLLFWSKDWFSLEPWTYDKQHVSYVDHKHYERKIGYMKSIFIGPLCVIFYKMKEDH